MKKLHMLLFMAFVSSTAISGVFYASIDSKTPQFLFACGSSDALTPKNQLGLTRNERDWKWTQAHVAARDATSCDVIRAYYEMHNHVDPVDLFGKTPLHVAAFHGNKIAANCLLLCGADIRKREPSYNNNAYQIAKLAGQLDFANWIFGEMRKLDQINERTKHIPLKRS